MLRMFEHFSIGCPRARLAKRAQITVTFWDSLVGFLLMDPFTVSKRRQPAP